MFMSIVITGSPRTSVDGSARSNYGEIDHKLRINRMQGDKLPHKNIKLVLGVIPGLNSPSKSHNAALHQHCTARYRIIQ